MRPLAAAVPSLVVAHAVACNDFDRPPPAPSAPPPAATDEPFFDGPEAGPPDPDASWLCGSLVVPYVAERPNLYFIVDASGSMAQEVDPPIPRISNLYQAARLAISDLLRMVGHRVQYGAAVFPGTAATEVNPCPAGREIFPTRAGDDASYAVLGQNGPVLHALMLTLAQQAPQGTTPTAATIRALSPALRELPGRTFVFLLTDGAPNCDPAAECTSATCEPNVAGTCNPANLNCCDPAVAGSFANLSCLDGPATANALSELRANGISTYVIGLPGTDGFGDILNELAIAGGEARETPPLYYSVDRADEIGAALKAIGASEFISCEVELSEVPPDRGLVNVYLDTVLVEQGDADGWRWLTDTKLEIIGHECDLLKAGEVLQVQVAAGCPTVIR